MSLAFYPKPAEAAVVWLPAVDASSQQGMNPTASQCGDALFVGVRGSAEADTKNGNENKATFGKTILHVKGLLQTSLGVYPKTTFTMRQVYIKYSAVNALNAVSNPRLFASSVKQGSARLIKFLDDERKNCPKESWVLSGFSQGAMVVDRAVAQLPASDNLRLTAIFNVADPYNSTDSGMFEVGPAGNSASGIYTDAYNLPTAIAKLLPKQVKSSLRILKAELGAPPARATWPYSGTYSYCQTADPVCNVTVRDTPSIVNRKGFAYHGDAYYKDAFMIEEVSNIAQLLSGMTSTPSPTPTTSITPTNTPSSSPPPSNDYVKFTDPALKACVLYGYFLQFKQNVTEITPAQLATIPWLPCTRSYGGITNLEGLQGATALTNASFDPPAGGTIAGLAILSTLPIQMLYVGGVTDVRPFTTITSLRVLSLRGSFASIAPLVGTPLTQLTVDSPEAADETLLSGMSGLTTLTILDSQLADASSFGAISHTVHVSISSKFAMPAAKVGDTIALPHLIGFTGEQLSPKLYSTASPTSVNAYAEGNFSGNDSVTWTTSNALDDGLVTWQGLAFGAGGNLWSSFNAEFEGRVTDS